MKLLPPLFAALTVSFATAITATNTDIPLIENAQRQVIFAPGQAGSKFYRIPALVTAMNGDLIAVIDARRESPSDLQHTRDIDIAIWMAHGDEYTFGIHRHPSATWF